MAPQYRKNPIEQALSAFVPILKQVYGEKLAMAALYGSAVTGGWVMSISDINIIAVVTEADPLRLQQLSKKAGSIIRNRRINLHILSLRELSTSADIFPAEYLELKETLRLLAGENLFEQLSIETTNLRHQVETMLRGAVQDLRKLVIAASGREPFLRRTLTDWTGSQPALYRAFLRLLARQPESAPIDLPVSADQQSLVRLLGERLRMDPAPLLDLLQLRNPTGTRGGSAADLTARIIETYLQLIEAADSFDAGTGR